jgi:FkbM family methyltransferase
MNHETDFDHPWLAPFDPLVSQQDVYYFFRHLLGRTPAEQEWPGHCATFVGRPLASALPIYLNSPEFKARRLLDYSLGDLEFVDLGGYGMYTSANDLHVGVHVREAKIYEPAVTSLFREHLRPGMRVIDVGANIGWFSCLAAHLVGRDGKVAAIEPGVLNAKQLLMSGLRNGWQHLEVLQVAASDRLETLVYSKQGSNGVVQAPENVEEALSGEIVFGITLDRVLGDGERWDLIKVDVEGYEHKVLRGASVILSRHHPVLVIEFSPLAIASVSALSGPAFLRSITEFGYSLSVISDAGQISCGDDVGKVLEVYEQAKVDHIDLLALPKSE